MQVMRMKKDDYEDEIILILIIRRCNCIIVVVIVVEVVVNICKPSGNTTISSKRFRITQYTINLTTLLTSVFLPLFVTQLG